MYKSIYKSLLTVFVAVLISSCEYEKEAAQPVCDLNPITISLDEANSTTSVACGTSDGQLVVVGGGGDAGATIEYSINQEAYTASNTFSNLGAGTYNLVARDANSLCESAALTVEVTNEGGLSISLASKENTDCGSTTGLISINATDGVEPILYKLNNGPFQSESVFSTLSPGDYTVTAQDNNGCEATLSNIAITTGVSLANDIQLIINTNCAVTGCHNNAQSPDLTTLEAIRNNANRIQSRTSNGSMPPSGREDLTPEEIDLIACWVEDGALNN